MDKSDTHIASPLKTDLLMKAQQACKTMQFVLLATALLLTPALSQAEPEARSLQDFKAVYRVEKYDSDIGRATYQLQHNTGEVHFFMRSELSGLFALFRDDRIEEDSWLKQTDKGLQLQRYSYKQTGSKRNRDTTLNIQWSDKDRCVGSASGTHAGKNISLKVDEGVRDALSFQLSLMQDAATPNAELDYQVLNKNELKQYTFRRTGTATLEIANHYIKTMIVERQQDDRTTRLWLATEFENIPVKIELIEENETDTRMLIDNLKLGAKQVL